jgi:hypothetical protein
MKNNINNLIAAVLVLLAIALMLEGFICNSVKALAASIIICLSVINFNKIIHGK